MAHSTFPVWPPPPVELARSRSLTGAQAGAENRLDRSLTPPTIEEETKNQEL